ncbi:hypothetical protein [Pedobacter aquatilis]|uniref:hypothetical protein n=1 Tax=Pedobacter aquatilis TaxID=351343 RepID=UPI0029307F1B|nr:hypothetical protein [Pedobacter aquatilis]
MKKLRLCCLLGDHLDLLPHFIKHYQSLGVDEFDFIIHSPDDCSKTKTEMLLQKLGQKPAGYLQGTWTGAAATLAINEFISRFPQQWFIIADSDEFQLYSKPLRLVIAELENTQQHFLTGCMLDRIAADGNLVKAIENQSIWEQFPLAGFISFPLMQANPLKITLCKGTVHLSEGQHGVQLQGNAHPIRSAVLCQVHHFKWREDILPKLFSRLQAIKLGHWEAAYKGYGEEIQRAMNYFQANQGHFQINETTFLLAKAKPVYQSYLHWEKVQQITASWKSLQSSSILSPNEL